MHVYHGASDKNVPVELKIVSTIKSKIIYQMVHLHCMYFKMCIPY